MCFSKLFASLIILLVLGLHIPPFFQEFHGTRQTFWPFMVWGMYRYSYNGKRPIETTFRRTVGITRKGEEVNITAPTGEGRFFNLFRAPSRESTYFVGLNGGGLRRLYLNPVWQGDTAIMRGFVKWLNRRRNDPIIALRLESETYTVTNNGLTKRENPVRTYRVLDK